MRMLRSMLRRLRLPRIVARMLRAAPAAGWILAALAAFGACSKGEDPNIILISIDTLRHDRLGFAGHEPEGLSPSPFLDGLASEGAVFTHMVSTSTWTLPAHYALMTGLPNELHEMVDDMMPYDPKVRTLAQRLKEKGYATGGFYSGPYLHGFFGFQRGFDMYESCMREPTMYDVLAEDGRKLTKEETDTMVKEKEVESHLDVTSDKVIEKARFFVRMNKRKKFFLFMHFFDVHNDYIPPPPFNKRYDKGYKGWVNGYGVVRDPRINPDMDPADLHHLQALYDGEIAWVDHNLQQFFETMEKDAPGMLENTLVIVVGDHGEEFFEHGKIGHRWNLHGETLRAPFLVHWPGRVPAGLRVDDPVRIYDVLPTILDLAGLPPQPDVYGRSLAPILRGETLPAEPIASELTFIPFDQDKTQEVYHKYYALQLGRLKMICFQKRKWSRERRLDFTGDLLEESVEVYDVEKDPGEKRDLALADPKLALDMQQNYRKEADRMRAFYPRIHGKERAEGVIQTPNELPESIREKLEQVGYIDGGRDAK